MEFQMQLDMELEMEQERELEMEMAGKPKKKRNTLEIMEDEYLNPRDRLSNLPEFIIHHIFSFLDYKQSGRAASVSRKFYRLWYTMPVLEFDTVRFPTMEFIYFIHKTMRRYLDNKIIINKLRLNVKLDYEGVMRWDLDGMISNSVEIAVKNNVEILDLSIVSDEQDVAQGCYPMKLYQLPEVVVSAKSLKFLKLQNLEFCFDCNANGGKSINLWSLECLHLKDVFFRNDDLLRHMITSCPLKVVTIENCGGYISQLNFSQCSKIRELVIREEESSEFGQVGLINLEASTLEDLSYYGNAVGGTDHWPLTVADPVCQKRHGWIRL